MDETVTMDELFRIAVEMEDIGRDFYMALGPAYDDKAVTRACIDLAKQEAAHRQAFVKMRQFLVGAKGSGATASKTSTAARLMRDQVLPTPAQVKKVALGGNLSDAIDMAIQLEKGAIAFYGQVVKRAPDQADAVNYILQAERAHLFQLREIRRRLVSTHKSQD